jgi:hypothetical protein
MCGGNLRTLNWCSEYLWTQFRSYCLFGGSISQAYLKSALDGLSSALPHAKRIEFPGLGHIAADNDEKPELVAQELRQFFRE